MIGWRDMATTSGKRVCRSRASSSDSPDRTGSSERYARQGNLSPLRSPLREEDTSSRPTKGRYRRNNKDWRSRQSQSQMSRWNREDSSREEPCWRIDRECPSTMPLNDQDFPSLENIRNNAGSSRQNPGRRSPPECTVSPSESRSRKWTRMDMSEQSPSEGDEKRRSWGEMMEDDFQRRNLVHSELERLKVTRKLDENGLPINHAPGKEVKQFETEEDVLLRRQKQIDYGKRTVGYQRYCEAVPRVQRTRDHPRTPYKFSKFSRRAWDTRVRVWRKLLHYYDPPEMKASTETEGMNNGESSKSHSSYSQSTLCESESLNLSDCDQ